MILFSWCDSDTVLMNPMYHTEKALCSIRLKSPDINPINRVIEMILFRKSKYKKLGFMLGDAAGPFRLPPANHVDA